MEIISIITNGLLVLAGFFAIVVYRVQKCDEVKACAQLILLEIQSIESEMAAYITRSAISIEELFQTTPIYTSLEWSKSKHLLSRKLRNESITAINSFYKSVVEFEDARYTYKQAVLINRNGKIAAIQNELANISRVYAEKMIEENRQEKNSANPELSDMIRTMDSFNRCYDNYINEFAPNSFTNFYRVKVLQYTPISNTPAYEALRKILGKRAR